MPHLFKVTATLVCIVASTSCQATATDDSNLIKVGVALPLSGTFADNGERHRAAIQMAFEDLEAAGKVKGKLIRAVVIDCGDKMATAQERLDAALGPWDAPTQRVRAIISSTTACHEASAAYALQQKTPHLEVSSGSDDDELSEYVVKAPATLDSSYDLQIRGLCRAEATMTQSFLVSRPDMRKIAVLRGGHPHDLTHTSTLRRELGTSSFASQGGILANDNDIVVPNDGPFSEGIQAVIALNPDTLYFHLNGDTRNLNFLAELKRLNFQGKIVTCGMIRKPIVLDPVSPGIIDYLGGKLFFMMRGPVGGAHLDGFKANYLAYYGKDADTFAPSAYDAAMLVGLALQAEAGSDGASLRDAILAVASRGETASYGEVVKALDLIKQGTDVNYDGASGTLDFHQDLTVPSKYYIDQVKYDATTQKGSFSSLPSPVVLK